MLLPSNSKMFICDLPWFLSTLIQLTMRLDGTSAALTIQWLWQVWHGFKILLFFFCFVLFFETGFIFVVLESVLALVP